MKRYRLGQNVRRVQVGRRQKHIADRTGSLTRWTDNRPVDLEIKRPRVPGPQDGRLFGHRDGVFLAFLKNLLKQNALIRSLHAHPCRRDREKDNFGHRAIDNLNGVIQTNIRERVQSRRKNTLCIRVQRCNRRVTGDQHRHIERRRTVKTVQRIRPRCERFGHNRFRHSRRCRQRVKLNNRCGRLLNRGHVYTLHLLHNGPCAVPKPANHRQQDQ